MDKLTEKVNRKPELTDVFLMYEDLERTLADRAPNISKMFRN